MQRANLALTEEIVWISRKFLPISLGQNLRKILDGTTALVRLFPNVGVWSRRRKFTDNFAGRMPIKKQIFRSLSLSLSFSSAMATREFLREKGKIPRADDVENPPYHFPLFLRVYIASPQSFLSSSSCRKRPDCHTWAPTSR